MRNVGLKVMLKILEMHYFCMKMYRKLFSKFTEFPIVFIAKLKQYYNTDQTSPQT